MLLNIEVEFLLDIVHRQWRHSGFIKVFRNVTQRFQYGRVIHMEERRVLSFLNLFVNIYFKKTEIKNSETRTIYYITARSYVTN